MDNFVNFLLDYYPYILGVLGIIIVTIIGYLADSKKKREKKLNSTDNTVKEEVKTTENATPIMEAVNEVPKTEPTEQINNVVSTPTNEVVNTPVNSIQNNVPVSNTIPQVSNVNEPVSNQAANVVNAIPVNQVVQPNVVQSNVQNNVPVQSAQQVSYMVPNQMPQQVMQPVVQQPQSIQQMPQTNQVVQQVVPQPINAVNLNQMVNGSYPNTGYAMPQAQAIPQPMPNQQVVKIPVTPMPNVTPSPAATPVNNTPSIGLNFVTGKTPETEKAEEEVWKL